MQNRTQTKRIEAYSIAEFVQQVQQAIREGYELDLNTNENYPQQFGTLFTCGVVPTQVSTQPSNFVDSIIQVVEDAQTETTPVKRGRKPAGV